MMLYANHCLAFSLNYHTHWVSLQPVINVASTFSNQRILVYGCCQGKLEENIRHISSLFLFSQPLFASRHVSHCFLSDKLTSYFIKKIEAI